MHHFSLIQLREMADALSIVAQLLETNPFYLRSKQIRQVEKSIYLIEGLISENVYEEAKFWKQSYEGRNVLQNKLDSIDNIQKTIESMEEKIHKLQSETRIWYGLDEKKRTEIVEHARQSKEFLKNQGDISEADVIQRYNRLLELKQLMPHADRASYLCDAIYHFVQKKHYHQNLEKLNLRIDSVHSRMKTVRNGLYVSLILCIFVATIPICVPFSITLWNRIQKLKSHLIIYEDLKRREKNRLKMADEGAQTIEEIQKITHITSYELIKETLMEIKDLKEEFFDSERFLSVCAMILSFIDTSQDILCQIFGQIPKSPHDRFSWLVTNVDHFIASYEELERLQSEKQDLYVKKKQIIKGYDRNLLTQSISKLTDAMSTLFMIPLSENNKPSFAEICLNLPEMTKKIKEILYYTSQNHEVNLEDWNMAHSCLKQYAYNLSLYVLDSEIEHSLGFGQSVDNFSTSINNNTVSKEIII